MNKQARQESVPNGQGVTFKVGDGVHWGFNGDAYPGTVRKVSASGRQVWVSDDDHEALPKFGKKHPCDLQKGDVVLVNGREFFVVDSQALPDGRHELTVAVKKDDDATHLTFKVQSTDQVDVKEWWGLREGPIPSTFTPRDVPEAKWACYTLNKWGDFKPKGHPGRGGAWSLQPDRIYSQNPCF